MKEEVPGELLAAVREVARVGAAEALRFFRTGVAIDGKASPMSFDPVTEGDRAAEAAMRAHIEARYPTHGILGEEYGERAGRSPWRWVLDPIDGTRGFVAGTPTWTTLVGLERDERPVAGAIAQPYTGELWLGAPGRAELFRGAAAQPCRASACTELALARLATTDPRPLPAGPMTDGESRRFLELGRRCPVTRFGNDAYAYGLLALGQIDLVVEAGLQRYDVAALIPVVRGAGAVISAWDGGPAHEGGRVLAAATPELHAAAMAVLASEAMDE